MAAADYWRKRTIKSLNVAERKGSITNARLRIIYDQTQKNIEKQIQSIYGNYSKKGILDVSELKRAIGEDGAKQFIQSITASAKKLKLKPSEIYDERYLHRLTRLQALQEQVQMEVMANEDSEHFISDQHYRDVARTTYRDKQAGFEGAGITPAFSTLDTGVLDAMMRSVWAKDNWSNRVWGNSARLSLTLKTKLGAGMLAGEDYQAVARTLRETFDVTKYESERLVRTETAYFHHEAFAQASIDDGIEAYTLDAILDSKTSYICRSIVESHVYLYKDRLVGENFPPLHPWCRTVPQDVLPEELEGVDFETQPPAFKDRVERFEGLQLTDDQRARFKAAMGKQMVVDKASTHDWNAEMNNITQSVGNGEIDRQQARARINNLMAEMPDANDYKLRGGLEMQAKLYGWEPEVTPAEKAVNASLKAGGVEFDARQLGLSPKTQELLAQNGTKFGVARTGGTDFESLAFYVDNKISVDMEVLKDQFKAFSRTSNINEYVGRVIEHETGHLLDEKIIQEINPAPADAWAIAKSRYVEDVADLTTRRSLRSYDPTVFKQAFETGDTVGTEKPSTQAATIEYFLDPDEVFAEGYRIYQTNPNYLRREAPGIYNYFVGIIGQP